MPIQASTGRHNRQGFEFGRADRKGLVAVPETVLTQILGYYALTLQRIDNAWPRKHIIRSSMKVTRSPLPAAGDW